MPNPLSRLQGAWQIDSLERHGALIPASGCIVINKNQFTTSGMGAEYTGRFELVAPNQIAMHFVTGPEAGNTNHGIYEITVSGWRLCLNVAGGPAPKTFKSSKNHVLETLIRAKEPQSPSPIDLATRQPVPELQGEWQMVSCLRSGEPLPPSFAKSGKRKIDGLQSTLHFGPQLFMQGVLSKAEGDPNAIRLEHTGGELLGHAQLGIFELAGNTLRTCFSAPGAPRPAKYESTKTGRETFAVWTRR